MFKRTNKAWKALALVLALCMLSSTVALADGDATLSTATLSEVTANYAEATQTATVTGKIDAKGNDVTILAVRGSEAADETDLAGWEPEDLQSMVTYIDQATSSETDGSFSFSFIPGRGTGGIVTVFVGGEGVDDIEVKTFEAKMPAPGLVAQEKWYEGDNTVEFTLKKADLSAEYNGDLNAWWTAVNAVNVKIGDADAVDMKSATSFANGVLTIDVTEMTGVEIKEITITTTANAYFDATWNVGVKQVKKTPGTLTAPTAAVVAGTDAEITVANADDTWATALANSVYVGGTKVEGVTYAENKLSVPMTIASDKLEDSVVVTVTQDYYTDATVTVNVVAPTANQLTADANLADSAVKVAYSATTPDEDATSTNMGDETLSEENKATWGQASITLPAAPAGFTYTWTMTCADNTAVLPENAATGLATGTALVLDRPGFESDKGSFAYVLTLTVEDEADAYAPATKTYNLSTNEVGVTGVDVSVSPNFSDDVEVNAAIMTTASFVLKDSTGASEVATLTYDSASNTFKASAITAGTYKLVISRPGYVTMTVDAVVDDALTVTLPIMVFGDNTSSDGTPDGKVNSRDYNALLTAYGVAEEYDVKFDFNGDSRVNSRDYNELLKFYGYPQSNDPNAQ